MAKKYKIKSSYTIRNLRFQIEQLLESLEQQNLLGWYDPDDPFNDPMAIDDIMMILEAIDGEELEVVDQDRYFTPPQIVMVKASYGVGGINEKLLDLIATELGYKPVTMNSCFHRNKYFNNVSKTLQFWYCPDCKKEV